MSSTRTRIDTPIARTSKSAWTTSSIAAIMMERPVTFRMIDLTRLMTFSTSVGRVSARVAGVYYTVGQRNGFVPSEIKSG
jgi:hypothetical protein